MHLSGKAIPVDSLQSDEIKLFSVLSLVHLVHKWLKFVVIISDFAILSSPTENLAKTTQSEI